MKIALIGYDLGFGGGGERWIIDVGNYLAGKGYRVDVYQIPLNLNQNNHHTSASSVKNSGGFLFRVIDPEWCRESILRRTSFLRIGYNRCLGDSGALLDLREYDSIYLLKPSFLYTFLELSKDLFTRVLRESMIIIGNHSSPIDIVYARSKVARFPRNLALRAWPLVSKIYFRYLFPVFRSYRERIHVHVLNDLEERFYLDIGFDRGQVHLIHNFIDFTKYRVGNNADFEICYLGRVTRDKGSDMLIEISRRIELPLNIVGSGPELHRLKAIEEINKNLKIHGYVPERTKIEILSSCDAMIIPSIIEMFPFSAIEGLASGLYLAASSISAGLEYIVSLHPLFGSALPWTADSFIDKLTEVYNMKKKDPEHYYMTKIERRQQAEKMFHAEIVLPEIERMFKNLYNEP